MKNRTAKIAILTILALAAPGIPASAEITNPTNAREREIVARIDDYFASSPDYSNPVNYWNEGGFIVTVVRADRTLLLKGYGCDDTTCFNLGAVSRTFSAPLVAQAVSEQKTAWTARVKGILPELRMQDEFTAERLLVKDLFAANSGAATIGFLPKMAPGYEKPDIFEKIASLPLLYPYNCGYGDNPYVFALSAPLLERVTGEEWGSLLKKRLLSPVGMEATSILEETAPLQAAEGLRSNAADMALWLKFQLNKGAAGTTQIVAKNQMQTIQKGINIEGQEDDSITLYGYGWHIRQSCEGRVFYAHGALESDACACCFLPYSGWGIMVAGISGTGRDACLAAMRHIVSLLVNPN